MFLLAQMIEINLTTIVVGAGALGMSGLIWLSRTRVEKTEDRLETALAESNEHKVHRATTEARLAHLESRVSRLESDR